MSADNWTKCPRCVERNKGRVDELRAKADEAYGKVPIEEWKALEAEATACLLEEAPTTLREDWEIGTRPDGRFSVRYGCSCTVCGFNFNYDHHADATERPS